MLENSGESCKHRKRRGAEMIDGAVAKDLWEELAADDGCSR